MVRSSLVRRTSDYKSSNNNFKYSQRGRKPFFRFKRSQSSFLRRETCSAKPPSSLLQGAERQGMNGQVNISPESHAYAGNLGSRVGAVVRALAFHQCVPGSIPGLGVICGLSLLVLYSAPRGFSPGSPVFPSLKKKTNI